MLKAEVLTAARKLKIAEVEACNAEAFGDTASDAVNPIDSNNYLISLTCSNGINNASVLLLVAPKDQIALAKPAQIDQGAEGGFVVGRLY